LVPFRRAAGFGHLTKENTMLDHHSRVEAFLPAVYEEALYQHLETIRTLAANRGFVHGMMGWGTDPFNADTWNRLAIDTIGLPTEGDLIDVLTDYGSTRDPRLLYTATYLRSYAEGRLEHESGRLI
jgi:hypothetical protein